MSQAKHTDGPWDWKETCGFSALESAAGDILFYTNNDDGIRCRNPKDYPLIKAAPDMRAALKQALPILGAGVAQIKEELGDKDPDAIAFMQRIYDDATAALKKADGDAA